MSCAFAAGSPWMSIGGTITITIVAVPSRSAWCIGLDRCIDDRERLRDRRITGRFETKAYQLQEASINDSTLVKGRPTITDVVANSSIGIARLREADKVRMGSERPIRSNGPSLYRS